MSTHSDLAPMRKHLFIFLLKIQLVLAASNNNRAEHQHRRPQNLCCIEQVALRPEMEKIYLFFIFSYSCLLSLFHVRYIHASVVAKLNAHTEYRNRGMHRAIRSATNNDVAHLAIAVRVCVHIPPFVIAARGMHEGVGESAILRFSLFRSLYLSNIHVMHAATHTLMQSKCLYPLWTFWLWHSSLLRVFIKFSAWFE